MMRNTRSTIADGLTLIFLALTVYHCQQVLNQFERNDFLSWSMAIGLDAGTAFAAFVTTSRTATGPARVLSGLWLVGLLSVGFGLNAAHYLANNGGVWSWCLAAVFPLSVSVLGAIKSGLVKLDIATTAQPNPETTQPAPQTDYDRELLANLTETLAHVGQRLDTLTSDVVALKAVTVEPVREPTATLAVQELAAPSIVEMPLVEVMGQRQGQVSRGEATRRLKETGKTWQEVANQLGVSVRTAQNYAKEV